MEKPLASIIMATYNREHFIEESLKAILDQTFQNWECLIIDDGSTDETGKILKRYTDDPRMKPFNRPERYTKGLPGCRNYGLDLAKGKYVVFFDDDDIAHPYLLELSLKEIETQKVDYCRYLRTTFIGNFSYEFHFENNYEIIELGLKALDLMVTGKIPFNSCQVLWNRECFERNRFDETLMYAEEWECYSRILARGYKGISLQKALYFGRKHEKSNTGEFKKNDPIRKASKIKATELIISHLAKKDLLNETLVKYFIQTGFRLKEPSIIDYVLEKSNGSFLEKFKYKTGYKLYPFIRPVLKLKGKLKKLTEG